MEIAEASRREAKLFKLDGRNPASVQTVEAVTARLLLGRSCRSTTLSTVDELTWIAARHNLVEIAEACWKEADACIRDVIRNCYGSR